LSAEIITAGVAAAVLIAVVVLRSATGGRVQVTLNDAIIAAIAAGLTLVMSGSIAKLGVSTTGVTIETAREAILSASARPVTKQVSALPVAPFEDVLKGGADLLPSLVQRRVQGVDFVMGMGGYVPDVVRTYLQTLSQYSFFRGFVLLDQNHKLFGVIDGRILLAYLQDPHSGMTFSDFVGLLNRASADDRARLAKLPGVVPGSDAAKPEDDKRDVLAKMERVGIDWWPVVNPQGEIIGSVERARLISSLILDVTDQLRASAPTQK
jgi:hypothetical protein